MEWIGANCTIGIGSNVFVNSAAVVVKWWHRYSLVARERSLVGGHHGIHVWSKREVLQLAELTVVPSGSS